MSDAIDAPRSNGSFSMLQSLVRTIHVNDAHSAGNCQLSLNINIIVVLCRDIYASTICSTFLQLVFFGLRKTWAKKFQNLVLKRIKYFPRVIHYNFVKHSEVRRRNREEFSSWRIYSCFLKRNYLEKISNHSLNI